MNKLNTPATLERTKTPIIAKAITLLDFLVLAFDMLSPHQ
ncbi:hypothetical protein H477_4898 [[Clostridium] sordellii ATCC 9714]|nr:hypothetical protein H477_4898 [[Clostridium] sordellii ATCC 9714] [Paeniclostridium sordellii ATCC 9714]EPZ54380.1 hypothetical protein H476_3189 [[Clostridium] sordellii VPI 9048] [Paeniclostridium sordellii VPI 9048]